MAAIAPAPERSREVMVGRLERVAAALVLFPTAVMATAVVGFALGDGVGAWVLPLAAVVSFAALWLFGGSLSETASAAAFATAIHVAAGLVAAEFPDGSWDGLAYQQEGILRLAAGWNPLFEDASSYGTGNQTFLNHYPKAMWIIGANVMASTGLVEAGKLFHMTLMAAALAMAAAAVLRLTAVRLPTAAALGAVVALNPVVIYQMTSFYVDGVLASLLTVMVSGLIVYVLQARGPALALAMIAACLAMNVKLTGLAYVGVLLLLPVPIVWAVRGLAPAVRMAAAAAAAGSVGFVLLGYAPYVRNMVEFGNLFQGAPNDDIASVRPVNFNDMHRVQRFFVSSFSRTEAVRPPHATRLKFPLAIGREEARGVYGPELEAGGFGPLYGAMLILAWIGLPALVLNPATRQAGVAVLVISACLLASMFVHGETWWVRYVPQAWLLPVLVTIVIASSRTAGPTRLLGHAIVILACVDILVVAANVGWNRLTYVRANQSWIQELSAAPQPIKIQLGHFRSLRRRLSEAGIEFVETPADTTSPRRDVPAPGDSAFWVD